MSTHTQGLALYSEVSGEAANLVGTWVTNTGSKMVITAVKGASFTGTFTSDVSPPAIGELVGTVAGDAIAFVVNWQPAFPSTTVWSGKLLSDKSRPVIYALWTLSKGVTDTTPWWLSFLSGSSEFTRVAS